MTGTALVADALARRPCGLQPDAIVVLARVYPPGGSRLGKLCVHGTAVIGALKSVGR